MATVTAPKPQNDTPVSHVVAAALEPRRMDTLRIHIAQAVRKMTEGWGREAIATVLNDKEVPERVYDALSQFGLHAPTPGIVYECIFFSFMLREEAQPDGQVRLVIENVKLSSVLRRAVSGPSHSVL